MATVAPIDIEKYLLQDEREELLTKSKRAPVKPPLDEALLQQYNSTAEKPLAPGELPPQLEQNLPPRSLAEGRLPILGTDLRGIPGAVSSIPGTVAKAISPPDVTTPADRSIAGATSPYATTPLATTPIPIARPSTVGSPPVVQEPIAPLAASEVPGTAAAKPAVSIPQERPSAWYDTIQRHAGFVRDMAEAGGNVLAGAGAFAFGAATAVSDILNAQLSRVARGGPMAGGPESSTHYRDIFARMDKTISDLTPEPRSDVAKNVNKVVGAVTGLVKDVAELPAKGLVATGILNEDTAKVLAFATELYLFYKLDRGVREAAPALRAKIADYKTRMSKATSDADVASAASDLTDAAARNPKLNNALEEARGKFRDEADFEAGREPGPRGPQPEGPAGGGTTFDISPEELIDYKSRLERANAEFDRLHPEGASIWTRKEYLEQNVTKPQGTPRPAPEPAPTVERPVQPEVVVGQETAVAPPVPAGHVRLYRTDIPAEGRPAATDPSQSHVASTYLNYIRDWRDANAPGASIYYIDVPYDPSDPMTPEPPQYITAQQRAQLKPLPGGESALTNQAPEVAPTPAAPRTTGAVPPAEVGPTPQAAATVAPETAPAPVSPETPAVAATPIERARELGILDSIREELASKTSHDDIVQTMRIETDRRISSADLSDIVDAVRNNPAQAVAAVPPIETTASYRGPTFEALRTLDNTASTAADRSAALSTIKREALNLVPKSVERGLRQLGLDEDTINNLLPQLKKVRAAKVAPTQPAVQTAATEAILDTAPAGTEVEIPAPAEPVVDTSPAIEKPKRKRRIVKAPDEAQAARNQAAEDVVTEMRGVRERTGNQIDYMTQQLNEVGANPGPIIREMENAFAYGMTPQAMRESLERRGIPSSVAEQVSGIAYDMHLRKPAPATATGEARYYNVRGINMLKDFAGSIPELAGGTSISRLPIQVRATQGAKPDAVFIDTSGLNARTKWSDIDVQQERGRMSEEMADMLRDQLRRQAELSGRLVEEAHQFTGQELLREATRIAAETGIDLYVKKGKNYELVPKDVVRTDARLNRGDDLAPTPISSDTAGAYVESKTSPIGPAQIREITEAVEQGIDISDRLPSELVPHYKEMYERERDGIDTTERRAFIDMLIDMNTMLGERGAVGGTPNRSQRMAAQRLQADMRKAGKSVREFLFGARPEDVAMFEGYLDSINNPVPPNSTNPRNMRFDPENIIPGDRIVKHRKVSIANDLDAVPLWQSEVRGIQNARDIKPGGTEWDLKLPLRQHKAAGTEFIYYAYRTAQKNLNAELNTLHSDMQELSRGFSSRSLENVGANGYARQGGDGQRILTYNKVTPRPLTMPERRLQATIDGIYAETFNRLQETRAATGREPLDRVDDYQTFARTMSLLNQLGIKVDLARATKAEVNAAYIKYRATNFPYLVRKHAFYSAEMNALKILDTYMQSALKDIHLSPFLAKLHELIETNLPDPVTSKETWALKDHKPGLYNELRAWNDFLATGTNRHIPDKPRIIMNTLSKNVAYATLSGLIRSAGIQLSTLVNTQQALGPVATFNGVIANLADHVSGGKRRQFALDNSEILASRKFVEAYNEVASAIIGRRPRDFFHAIRTGDFGAIQSAVGRPGFKLMELMDMEAAVMSWNTAYKQARGNKMNYNHKDAVRFADDLVVRTQGSSMPGDLSGVQRNALGKLATQFQTFLISDWNFLTNEVLSKGKVGGGGGGQIPPGGVVSGSGSWETGGPRSKFQMVKNIIQLLIATQLVNELYKMLHIQPAQPDPVEDVRKGLAAGHGPVGLALDVAIGQTERVPIIGGALRYGSGITGPATEAIRDLVRAGRNDPLVRNPYEGVLREAGVPEPQIASKLAEPASKILGIPYTRQAAKTALAIKRGENAYDSLMGWYTQEQERTRPERRERASRR